MAVNVINRLIKFKSATDPHRKSLAISQSQISWPLNRMQLEVERLAGLVLRRAALAVFF